MKIEVGDRGRPIVEARPGKAHKLALSGNGDDVSIHVDEPPLLLE
jgi:hypothetical protein